MAPGEIHRGPFLKTCQVWGTADMPQEAIRHILVNTLPDAYEQDVGRLQADVWLGRRVLAKALRSEELRDQLAVLAGSEAHALDVKCHDKPMAKRIISSSISSSSAKANNFRASPSPRQFELTSMMTS
jgi:hypothetical protein